MTPVCSLNRQLWLLNDYPLFRVGSNKNLPVTDSLLEKCFLCALVAMPTQPLQGRKKSVPSGSL